MIINAIRETSQEGDMMRLSNVKRFCLPLTGSILLAVLLLAVPMSSAANETFVRLGTDSGEILIYMDSTIAPNHVNNFLKLGRDGFYTGTVFHRVIPGFMIQGGDPNSKDENRGDDGMGGPKWADVLSAEDMAKLEEVRSVLTAKGYLVFGDQAMLKEEFNLIKHVCGTLSMARSRDVNLAGSQFFICVARAANLDNKYTAFGQVVTGMGVADDIVSAPRNNTDYPDQPTHITSFTVLDGVEALTEDESAAWLIMQGESATQESSP
jgi:peptidyl-prolyl cis-trans isomerase B (cyclophilin B)